MVASKAERGADVNDDVAATDAQRRELQRRVFSSASDAADARVAARQLQQLDSHRLQQARQQVPTADVLPPSIPTPSQSEAPPTKEAEPRPPEPVAGPTVADLALSPFSAARVAAAVLLSLVVGIAVGVSASARPVADPPSAPLRTVVDTSGALALFDRPQVTADLPAQALPGTVIGESIRAIGDPFFELYIGRNAANMVCLFAVQPADSFAMSCVTIDEFPSTGVRLEWSGEMPSISADGSAGVVPSTMRAIWRPDGSLDLGGGPR
jgi:hypothetical protein